MLWDWIVVAMLLCGLGTGVYTIQRHHDFFRDFRMPDLFRGRFDACLYLLNVLSTSFCLIDAGSRILWLYEVGWDAQTARWRLIWLSLHACGALLATGFHLVTNRLLDRKDFCNLCRRPR